MITAAMTKTSQAVWTTDTHLWHAMLIGDAHGIAETVPAFEAPDAAVGVRLLIHETLLNTLVDRAGMKGLKTTDKKLRELQDWLLATAAAYSADGANQLDDATELDDGARLNGANESLKPPLPSVTETFVTDIEFDDVEPLTMRLERDRLLVTIKARFKPAGQEIVPPMTVTIPYKTELVGNKIRWVAGQPRVVAQDRTDASAPQTIFESMIERVIEADLIPLEFDRVLPASLWKGNGPAPRIASVKSDHGWVTIVIE